jgi:lysine 2,3-aminomutase
MEIKNSTLDTVTQRHVTWRSVPENQWLDWRWQMAQRIVSADDLGRTFPDTEVDEGVVESCTSRFRIALTPYYADLIARQGKDGPLWRQAVPSTSELDEVPGLASDPLGEEGDSPVEGLLHRYEDRALMLLTDRCGIYCRYCNRRRRARGAENDLSPQQVDRCIAYLKDHSAVREVILSGGDPLTWSDARLEDLLEKLRGLPSIEIIRIGSLMPVVLPYRVTEDLCRILKKYQPLFLNVHVNHPAELSPEMREACEKLADAGIPLGSQTVLLKGINDDPLILQQLFRKLLTFRIRPYSLYHADPVQGTEHFRTSIERGRAIMEYLTANTSGMAMPHYVLDAPGGLGKIPICTDYVEGRENGGVMLRSPEGERVSYVDGEG